MALSFLALKGGILLEALTTPPVCRELTGLDNLFMFDSKFSIGSCMILFTRSCSPVTKNAPVEAFEPYALCDYFPILAFKC